MGSKNIQAVCIDFCTEEIRYNQPDSHIVHIPRDLWHRFIEQKTKYRIESLPLYVGIRNSNNPKGKKFYFGRVEPSVNTSNSNHKMALLPRWLFEYLEMDTMESLVDIVFVSKITPVDIIFLKGNKSSYVKTDIKRELEEKLDTWNCINNGEVFKIRDVTFTVTNLKSSDGEIINFGSIYSGEVKIEFEEPDDIKETRERIEKEDKKVKEMKEMKLQKARCDSPQKGRKYGAHVSGFSSTGDVEEKIGKDKVHDYLPFQGDGLKLTNVPARQLTKAELLEVRLKKMGELAKTV